MSIYQEIREDILGRIEQWSGYSSLLGAGVVCYLGLVAGMIYAIVTQIHVEEWPAPTVRAANPVVLTIPVLDLVAEPCIHAGSADGHYCDAKSKFDAAREKMTRRYSQQIRAGRNGTGNLLWAPPGAVLMLAEEPTSTSAAAPIETRAATHWSTGNTTVASR